MIYIAYGSNMSKEQMSFRCPNSRLIGTGRLYGAQLEFFRHATVIDSEIKERYVPVAIWDISSSDEKQLDRYEGYPNYYSKHTCRVKMDDGSHIEGMIYLMEYIMNRPPDQHYYQGIREAYMDLGFASEVKKVLLPALMRSHKRYRR